MVEVPDVKSIAKDIDTTLKQVAKLGPITRDNHPVYERLVLQAIKLSTDIQLKVGQFVREIGARK